MDKGKRKHKSVSFEEKLVALKRLDNGERIKKVAADMGVGSQTVGDWRKNRNKIEDYCTTAAAAGISDRKRMRLCDNPQLDSGLYLWVTQERKKGTLITGPLLQEKALSMNAMLKGDACFSASAGWLDRFKKRHGISHLHIADEKCSANSEAMMVYKSELMKLVAKQNLSPDQVYNCNEMSLHFKKLPGKALAALGENSTFGLKHNDKRITVLACSNASGTHKLPLIIVGEPMTMHSFRHFHMNALPVHYRVQKNALMTEFIFKEWFEDEFVPRVKTFLQNEKISSKAVLLTNNAVSHPNDSELQVGNIKGIFLGPPNTITLRQSMDQVIIENLKRHYRHKFLHRLHKCKGNDDSLLGRLKAINMKSVIDLFAEAWDEIENRTLVRSWRKLWPEVENIVKETRYKAVDMWAEPNEHVSNCTAVFVNMFKNLPGCDNITEYDVEEWVTGECDDNTTQVSSEEIIDVVLQQRAAAEESNEDVGDHHDPNRVSHTDATRALEIALSYVEQQQTATSADVLLLKRWRNYAAARRPKVLKQTKITSYFTKECFNF